MKIDVTKPLQAEIGGGKWVDVEFVGRGRDDDEQIYVRYPDGKIDYWFESDDLLRNKPPEARELWVNEYDDGINAVHKTEAVARSNASSAALRVAVRYREVIES